MSGIFVSYRRNDSQGEAGRLFDDLVKHFDEHTVFMDVAAIEAGRDFRKAIEEGVTKCGVLLVVIGLEWLEAKDEHGTRRLNDPADFVRIETAAALKRDIPVIPVLVRGAKMPTAEQLPDELKELAYRNCIELTHARWRSDIQLLIEALRRLAGDTVRAGAAASANQAAATLASHSPRQPAGAPAPEKNFATIDLAVLDRVSRELALHIGPIAAIVVKRAAANCHSAEDLYLKVADEIESRDARDKFLRERASIPPAVIREAIASTRVENRAPEVLKSHSVSDLPARTSSPAAVPGSSNRQKYFLLAGATGCAVVLALVLVSHFSPSRGPVAPQTARASSASPPLTDAALEKTAVQAPPPAEPGGKSEQPAGSPAKRLPGRILSTAPKRATLAEEVSKELVIKKVSPIYPVLARQAHIQGVVVLDVDISKDGAVETIRVVSGHPLLIQAAVDAVKQWRYKPYVENGDPVAVGTKILVAFSIANG